jgi:hypothetical protein
MWAWGVCMYVCMYVCMCILWHTDLLLDNDRETYIETTAIALQHFRKYATVLEPLLSSGSGTTVKVLLEAVFSMGPLRGYVTQPTKWVQYRWIQWSEVNLLVSSQLIRRLLWLGPCELIAEARAQWRENVRRWKLLPDNDRWQHSRLRFNTCCSELQNVWISDSAIVACSHHL